MGEQHSLYAYNYTTTTEIFIKLNDFVFITAKPHHSHFQPAKHSALQHDLRQNIHLAPVGKFPSRQ